jgi:hypothetical protein
MSFRLRKRTHKRSAFAAAAALLLLTGCAVDSEAILLDSVTGISQAILDALLDALSSYLASS